MLVSLARVHPESLGDSAFVRRRRGHKLLVPYEVECLHCGKRFQAERPLRGTSDSQTGFKCPHCGLFVSLERAEPEEGIEPVEE